MATLGLGACFIGSLIFIAGVLVSVYMGGVSESSPIMTFGLCLSVIGIVIQICAVQNINVVYTANSVPVALKTVQSLDACKEYALNYLKGVNGHVRCIGEDGAVLWTSPQNK